MKSIAVTVASILALSTSIEAGFIPKLIQANYHARTAADLYRRAAPKPGPPAKAAAPATGGVSLSHDDCTALLSGGISFPPNWVAAMNTAGWGIPKNLKPFAAPNKSGPKMSAADAAKDIISGKVHDALYNLAVSKGYTPPKGAKARRALEALYEREAEAYAAMYERDAYAYPEVYEREAYPEIYEREAYPEIYEREAEPEIYEREAYPEVYERDVYGEL